MKKSYDIIVLGSGPGGYVAAIRASQLGLKTAIIEKESLGGVCLNWGCIPTKALLKSAQVFEYLKNADHYGLSASKVDKDFTSVVKRSRSVADGMSKGVNFLMKKNKIDVINGFGKLLPEKKVSVEIEGKKSTYNAENIIIATGSTPTSLPGVKIDEKIVVSSTGALSFEKVPKELVVIGGGYIGLELSSVWKRLGSNVTVIEYLDHIIPGMDKDVSNEFLNQRRRLLFTNIPSQATIKIFTVSGILVDVISVNNSPQDGTIHWDMLTREGLEIAAGMYLYHVESISTGDKKLGKFAVIK